MKVLILYQASRGGTNVVLSRASNWLQKQGHIVTDVSFFEESGAKEIDLVLLPTSEMYRLALLMKNTETSISGVLVWAMGSRAFHGAYVNPMKFGLLFNFFTYPLRILANNTLESFLLDRALIFTDEVGMYTDMERNRDRATKVEDLIYPVPVDIKYDIVIKSFPSRPKRLMWIGRIDRDFKVLPLIRVIRDISSEINNNNLEFGLEFLIVGTGDGSEFIQKEIVRTKNMKFKWVEWVELDELDELLDNVDILFAMGASALQGARRGIPTVVVQPFSHSSQEVPNIYRWIHQSIGHSLGEFLWFHCQPVQPNCSFGALLEFGSLTEHAVNSFEYSKKFDTEIIFKRLFDRELSSPLSNKTKLYLNIYLFIFKLKTFCKFLISKIKIYNIKKIK